MISLSLRIIVQWTFLSYIGYCPAIYLLSPPFRLQPYIWIRKNAASLDRTCCGNNRYSPILDLIRTGWRHPYAKQYRSVFPGIQKGRCFVCNIILSQPIPDVIGNNLPMHLRSCAKMFSLKTRTGRSAASFVCTSANITLAQPVLPAIDSKTFTDYGPLLSTSQVRTVPLSPDSVKRWAHFHRDGSLGAWSCLCDIIAQMFDKVNLTPVPKWVWERNCKKYFQFSRYIGNLSNQWASLLSTYKDAFKNTICSTWAKIFKIPPSTI